MPLFIAISCDGPEPNATGDQGRIVEAPVNEGSGTNIKRYQLYATLRQRPRDAEHGGPGYINTMTRHPSDFRFVNFLAT